MNERRWAQLLAIIRIEIRKTFFARRGLWIYLLALAPVGIFLLHAIIERHLRATRPGTRTTTIEQAAFIFAHVFQFFFVRLAVFFGCLGIFMNLFRGEMLDKSLHYYLLAPVKREIVLSGKFVAGLIAASVVFASSALLQQAALFSQFDGSTLTRYLFENHGLANALVYAGISVMACVGYGSIFLAAGLLFRNPIFPAALVLVWEGIDPILPSTLQKLSVIYYIKSMCPVATPVQPGMPPLLALLISNVEPVSGYVAILGLLALSIVIVGVSMARVRKLEISYSTE
jgi:ABC-type transport system involved in multi-copper enzyme maturation permease subunit